MTAFRALLRTYGLVGRIMQPYFAGFGISGAQWGVLRTLARAEEERQRSLCLGDLSERLIVRPPSVTGVVNRLERMELVKCRTSAADRRVKHIRLTASGRRLVRRVLAEHEDQIGKLLGGLGAQEQKRLERLLCKLAAHLEGVEDGKK